jgi:hypothetical protein
VPLLVQSHRPTGQLVRECVRGVGVWGGGVAMIVVDGGCMMVHDGDDVCMRVDALLTACTGVCAGGGALLIG